MHNFGAAAVVGGATFMSFMAPKPVLLQRKFAWLVGLGWGVQALSGALFGAISHHYYGKFPDIHDIAIVALVLLIFIRCLEKTRMFRVLPSVVHALRSFLAVSSNIPLHCRATFLIAFYHMAQCATLRPENYQKMVLTEPDIYV